MGACGPPGASRCCARASLRTPSRPHPPHDGGFARLGLPAFSIDSVFLSPEVGSAAPSGRVSVTASSVAPMFRRGVARTRGVGAGRSAQRGTSAATTGPRGARSAPPNPESDLARSAPPNPEDCGEILRVTSVDEQVFLHCDVDKMYYSVEAIESPATPPPPPPPPPP